MFFTEQPFYTEDEARIFIEAMYDSENASFRETFIDPIIKILETPKGRKEYIECGNEFIERNAEMLAKPYPTKAVSYPPKYIDRLFEIFQFDKDQFNKDLRSFLKTINNSDFKTIMGVQTNVLHTIVLFYSDMVYDRKLRDSARHQIGLTDYAHVFARSFPKGVDDERVMEYTHSQLNGTWGLIKAENVMTWIGHTVEVAYGRFRSELNLDMNVKVMASFIGRVRTSFKQNLRLLANRYYDNLDMRKIGSDTKGDEDYLTSTDYAKVRDNLMRMIQSDSYYNTKSKLYDGIASLKNVKADELYEFSMKVKKPDIRTIIDTILYVFLIKEGNTLNDINSSKYIGRITKFPTAIDRAIQGKPIILPMMEKYNASSDIVKAYICVIATYIMYRLNDSRPSESHII